MSQYEWKRVAGNAKTWTARNEFVRALESLLPEQLQLLKEREPEFWVTSLLQGLPAEVTGVDSPEVWVKANLREGGSIRWLLENARATRLLYELRCEEERGLGEALAQELQERAVRHGATAPDEAKEFVRGVIHEERAVPGTLMNMWAKALERKERPIRQYTLLSTSGSADVEHPPLVVAPPSPEDESEAEFLARAKAEAKRAWKEALELGEFVKVAHSRSVSRHARWVIEHDLIGERWADIARWEDDQVKSQAVQSAVLAMRPLLGFVPISQV